MQCFVNGRVEVPYQIPFGLDGLDAKFGCDFQS